MSPRAWGLLRDRELGKMHAWYEGQYVWLEQSSADVCIWLVRSGPELSSLLVVKEGPLPAHPMSEEQAEVAFGPCPLGVVGVYVDDLLLTAPRPLVECLVAMITRVWGCSEPDWAGKTAVKFFGVEVRRAPSGVFHLSQETYLSFRRLLLLSL